MLSSGQLNCEEASQKGRRGGKKIREAIHPLVYEVPFPEGVNTWLEVTDTDFYTCLSVLFCFVSYAHCGVLCYYAHNKHPVISAHISAFCHRSLWFVLNILTNTSTNVFNPNTLLMYYSWNFTIFLWKSLNPYNVKYLFKTIFALP